jgi:Na+-transporting methylmalonyl-CoA/oxaloacetate decarboxylase gamma subunit
MSNVSSGVFATVKRLPPNTGRIATVVVAALILLAVIVWGIAELYKATSGTQPPETPPAQTVQTPPAPTETTPKASDKKTSPEANAKPIPKAPKATDKKAATKTAPSKPATQSKGLKSSGVEVPSLYID